jgi:hypothetical protein
VAQRAGDADRGDPAVLDLRDHAHHGVAPEQLDRRRGRIEVRAGKELRRQHGSVDLEAHGECGLRAHRGLDHLVQAQVLGPEVLVAEGIEAKDVLAVVLVSRSRSARRGGVGKQQRREGREERGGGGEQRFHGEPPKSG